MGGLIICDFIDMRDGKHRREVEKVFREGLRKDRARSRALRMSAFGLIELTRQRMRPSLQLSTYLKCPHCKGQGFVKSEESRAIEVLRMVRHAATKQQVRKIELTAPPQVADFLLNKRRNVLAGIEEKSEKIIIVSSDWLGQSGDVKMGLL